MARMYGLEISPHAMRAKFEAAGLQAGDVVDCQSRAPPFSEINDYRDILQELTGDSVNLTVERNGDPMTIYDNDGLRHNADAVPHCPLYLPAAARAQFAERVYPGPDPDRRRPGRGTGAQPARLPRSDGLIEIVSQETGIKFIVDPRVRGQVNVVSGTPGQAR